MQRKKRKKFVSVSLTTGSLQLLFNPQKKVHEKVNQQTNYKQLNNKLWKIKDKTRTWPWTWTLHCFESFYLFLLFSWIFFLLFLLVTIFKKFPLPCYTRNVPVFEILKVLFLTLKFPAREKDSDNIIIQNLDTLFTH